MPKKGPLFEKADVDRHDIKARLGKRKWTLRKLSIANGYHPDNLKRALTFPYPHAEKLIARAAGFPHPMCCFGSRYHDDGTPKSGRGERGIGRKHSTGARRGNVRQGLGA